MTPLGFVQSWLEDMRWSSSVDGADATMMQEIKQRLQIMEGVCLPQPKFLLGQQVQVTQHIVAQVERIEFRRGNVVPWYNVSWWSNGGQTNEWFIEPDLTLPDD